MPLIRQLHYGQLQDFVIEIMILFHLMNIYNYPNSNHITYSLISSLLCLLT